MEERKNGAQKREKREDSNTQTQGKRWSGQRGGRNRVSRVRRKDKQAHKRQTGTQETNRHTRDKQAHKRQTGTHGTDRSPCMINHSNMRLATHKQRDKQKRGNHVLQGLSAVCESRGRSGRRVGETYREVSSVQIEALRHCCPLEGIAKHDRDPGESGVGSEHDLRGRSGEDICEHKHSSAI